MNEQRRADLAQLDPQPGLLRATSLLGWLGWSLLTANLMLFHTLRAAPAAAADRLMADFQLDGAALGYLAAATILLFALMQPVAGVLVDALGPRLVGGVGMLVGGVGAVAFAMTDQYPIAVVCRLVVGFGTSVMFVSLARHNADWFPGPFFSSIISYTSSATHFGAILATFPIAWGLEQFGWRVVFAFLGCAALAAGLFTLLFVRERLVVQRATLRQFPRSFAQVLGVRWTWSAVLTVTGLYAPYLGLTGMWGLAYLMQVFGYDRHVGTLMLAVPTVGVIVTNLLLAKVAQKAALRRKLCMALGAASAVAWTGLAASGSALPIVPLLIGFLLLGAGPAAFTVALTSAREAHAPALTGVAVGTANMGGFLGGVFAQPVIGYLLDRYWTGQLLAGARVYPTVAYRDVLLFSAVITLAGTLAALGLYIGQDPAQRE